MTDKAPVSINSVLVDQGPGAIDRYIFDDRCFTVVLELDRRLDEYESRRAQQIFDETAGEDEYIENLHYQNTKLIFTATGMSDAQVFIERFKTEAPGWFSRSQEIHEAAKNKLLSIENTLKQMIV